MKKIISVLLCVVMLLGMLPILPTFAEAEGADLSGIADGGKYVDDKGNEYTVLKSADTILNLVKADMSGNFILGNDIDFNNKRFYSYMFNNDGEAFSGVFDGNGYAIKNFYTTANFNAKVGLLFGGLTGDARIQNLTVGGEGENIPFSITSNVAGVVGGLAGYTVPGAKVVISNVKVYADITIEAVIEKSVFVGGIIGQCDPITVLDTDFHGSISFTESATLSNYVTMVGGIVARCNQAGERLNVINCKNYADISAANRTIGTVAGIKTVAGGIVGSSDYSFTVRNCENYGAITGDKTVGGIVGEIVGQSSTQNSYEMIGCRNYGDITGQVYVAGILAFSSPNTANNTGTTSTYSISILNCLNVADITALTTDPNYLTAGSSGAAGIAGRINRGYITIQNCGSVGDVSGTGRTGNSASTSNGLYGIIVINQDEERLSVIADCYAVGTLTPYAENYTVYGTGAVYTDKIKYLPFITNCHYDLTATKGTLKALAMSQVIQEDYGDYPYVASGAVSSDEVANGALLTKLGDGFEQTVGTDAYPIPVQPEYTFDMGSDNLFSKGAVGYYNNAGAWVEDDAYSTRKNIAVSTGTVITVGAFSTDQVSFGYLFDSSKAPVKALSLSDMTLVSDLGGGYGIYSYTVAEGEAYVSISVFSRRAYITLITTNDPFDATEFYDYFGISAMTGDETSPLWQKSALFLGDSICYGFDDVAIGGKLRAYGGRVAYHYDMEWVNAGVSGATLSTVTTNRVLDQLRKHEDQNFDYVLIEGGINDALKKVTIGGMSNGLYAGLDDTTYAGALEQIFREVTRAFPRAKVGFLITYKCPRNNSHETYITYQEVTKAICEKWDVAYFDMFSSDEINDTVLESSNRNSVYMPDGIHPSEIGYDRMEPYISEFMETLEVPVPSADHGSGNQGNQDNQGGQENDNSNPSETQPTPDETQPSVNETTEAINDGNPAADTGDGVAKGFGCDSNLQICVFPLMVILAFAMMTKKEKQF